MILILFFQLYNCYNYGEYVKYEDRVLKNGSLLYYYYNNNNQHKKCINSSNCQLDWCSSGSICSKEGYCLNLMEFPCPHTMKCNSIKKICEPKLCFTKYECHDYIYCNGYELCENRTCKRSVHPCFYGTCSEKNQNCSFIKNIATFSNFTKILPIFNKDPSFISIPLTEKEEEEFLFHIKLSGDPLWNANDLGIQITWLVLIIVLFVLVIGILLFLIIKSCQKKRVR